MTSALKANAPAEPELTLPFRAMLVAGVVVLLIVLAVWLILYFGGWIAWPVAWAGLLGSAAIFVIAGVGVAIMQPWKPRLAGDLATLWLGSTVARMLLTPGLALLLYFALYPPTIPFVLGVGTAYLVILVSETALLWQHLRRQFNRVQHPVANRVTPEGSSEYSPAETALAGQDDEQR